ncbi:TPA: hypothetical protein N0F65_005545 [Lagenidium giganteum]|uniref:Autophagy-related protein 2 n=1 Tax=Lagenidium giganteum TaxID=4803 RepID=A0AAV2YVZ5_9STRA|nr:TPA: hypothetical protein N0F65_005545 [Lagenidium giganteum]
MNFFKQLTDPALKRLYKFVLKRLIGRFLADDEIDLDQLDVHLGAGRIELCDLLLNADVINADVCEANNLPFSVKKGYLGSVRVAISYTSIMSESCLVEIDDIELVLEPVRPGAAGAGADDDDDDDDEALKDAAKATSVSPDELAKKKTPTKKVKDPVDEISQEGLDFVASWIEQVTSKIKVTLSNICVRLETGERDRHGGVDAALLFKIQWVQLTDDSMSDGSGNVHARTEGQSSFLRASQASMAASSVFGITHKGVRFKGISLELLVNNEEYNGHGVLEQEKVLHPFLVSDPTRQCFVQMKISHYEAIVAPSLDADVFLHSLRVALQPQHFSTLSRLIDAFSVDFTKVEHDLSRTRHHSMSLYHSVCDARPAWMMQTDDDGDGSAAANGSLNLSYREFQRIEQLLLQYRKTHEDLKNVQRRVVEQAPVSPTAMRASLRKLSIAESIESGGLSDLDEDDFFDCEAGAESISANVHMGASSTLGQSMYASAMYEHPAANEQSSMMHRSSMIAGDRPGRQMRNRVKVHLLECDVVLLYDDLPDEDPPGRSSLVSDVDESPTLRPASPRSAPLKSETPTLPSVNGMERLEISFKDVLCSCLIYPSHAAVSLTIGTIVINEKMLPRMSMDVEEEEEALLTTTILRFVDSSPVTGRKVHLSANLSSQIRVEFNDQQDVTSVSVQVTSQPIILEWDMYVLDRAHRLLKLMEESAAKANSMPRVPSSITIAKKMEIITDCAQVHLRFPMVTSDLIRFGPSSKRGLCEDKMVITLVDVRAASTEGDDAAESQTTKLPLPWLSEFDVHFNNAAVSLLTPAKGNQRSTIMDEVVLITGKRDEVTSEDCILNIRMQLPTEQQIRAAVRSREALSKDVGQHDQNARPAGLRSPVAEDNDGGRLGNGWSEDAWMRAEQYEADAACASLMDMEISIPHLKAEFLKPSFDRLMLLFDALLLINPIDVNAHNQMMATPAFHARLLPSYMAVKLRLAQGLLKLSDFAKPSDVKQSHSMVDDESSDAEDRTLISFLFAFEELKIFQIGQWLGQLVSRMHVSAQNVSLLEASSRNPIAVPVLYKTPFGTSSAPLLFVAVDIVDQTQEMREMKVEMNVSHVSLRYDPTSLWLLQMLDILMLIYPLPVIPLDSANMSEDEITDLMRQIDFGLFETVNLAVPPKTIFTKLLINFYDVLVDYAPPGITSRTVLSIGNVTVSSNVVSGAVVQGYKISVKDIQLSLAQFRQTYDEIDQQLLGRELCTNKPKTKTLSFQGQATEMQYPSLHDFLEKSGFLQMITMDFIEVFLRAVVPPDPSNPVSADSDNPMTNPELSVELNLGTANIYACFDSFNTLLEVITVLTEQLAVEEQPCDTTAYVGLDRVKDVSSVSIVTNIRAQHSLSDAASSSNSITRRGSTADSLGTGEAARGFDSKTSFRDRQRSHSGASHGASEIDIYSQIEENAFGGGKSIFPGKHVATDMEARLLRTRLEEIEKQKNRVMHGDSNMRDDELTATQLRDRYRTPEPDQQKSRVRINELVIEDYYGDRQSALRSRTQSDDPGGFLMEPLQHQPQEQLPPADPWFLSDSPPERTSTLFPMEQHDPIHPVGSLPDEQAARWIPNGSPFGRLDGDSASSSPRFDPVEEEHSPLPAKVNDRTNFGITTRYAGEEVKGNERDDEFPMAAFPGGAVKNWWGMEGQRDEIELSELQTEETESSFSHHPAFPDDQSSQAAMNHLSMSIIGGGDDEGTEVELDFQLDQEMQSRFNRMLNVDSSEGADQDDQDDDEYQVGRSNLIAQAPPPSLQRQSSNPVPIPRKSSFSSTASHVPPQSVPLIMSPPEEPTARWFHNDTSAHSDSPPLKIYPHHVEIPIGGSAATLAFGEQESDEAIRIIARESVARKTAHSAPVVVRHILLRNFSICMRFFGGNDWSKELSAGAVPPVPPAKSTPPKQSTAPGSSTGTMKTAKLLDALLDDYVPSSDGMFGGAPSDSLFSGAKSAPAGNRILGDRLQTDSRGGLFDAPALTKTRKRSLKSGRKTEEMLELLVTKIQLRLDMFNNEESQPLASNAVLALGDIEILDYISTSQIRKIICYWKSDSSHPRETGSSMVHVHLMTVRPGPNLCEEHRLRVKILPLRVNLDQEVVNFLRQFVPPVDAAAAQQQQSRNRQSSMDDDVPFAMDSGVELSVMNPPTSRVEETEVNLGGWFFQNIDIRPCKIKIDYRPNRVDFNALRSGDYLEVINLFVLEGMELVLRRVKMSGIDGWPALGEQVLMSWVNDITRHQIHKCVASVSMPPLRSFANIGSGAADLILLPMEHYGKDRRIVRGMKKGAKSFLKSVTIETLNTASKVAQGTQALLEHADDVMSSSRRNQRKYRQAGSRIKRNSKTMGGGGIRSAHDSGGGIGSRQYLAQQPSNATEGLYQAYDSLSRELHVAAKTIVAVPLVEYKKTGSQGYVRSVIRAVPVAVLRPMIGATEAVSKALIGVRNAVDPELMEDVENKFKDFRTI